VGLADPAFAATVVLALVVRRGKHAKGAGGRRTFYFLEDILQA
jgi:hypothetical protein